MRNTGGLSQAREEPPYDLMRVLRLKRENMILEDENKTLKKKLQKAYDFMKAVYHQWAEYAGEFFCNLLGKKMREFSENIGFDSRGR